VGRHAHPQPFSDYSKEVSASTQNQAFNVLLFLFRNVLYKELKNLADTVRAKRRFKLPVVLSRKEVNSLFSYLSGQYLLMAKLLYGSGLRLLVGISFQESVCGSRK